MLISNLVSNLALARSLGCRVTHFDLKSANVLLTKELAAKISDVGLAK